jgi:hypothetical protein
VSDVDFVPVSDADFVGGILTLAVVRFLQGIESGRITLSGGLPIPAVMLKTLLPGAGHAETIGRDMAESIREVLTPSDWEAIAVWRRSGV